MSSTVQDPIDRLFTMLFRDQSIAIIRACFDALKSAFRQEVGVVITAERETIGEAVEKRLQKPVYQLYLDLTDLEYSASEELVTIVAEESQQLFSEMLEWVPRKGDALNIAFVYYSLYCSIQHINSTYGIELMKYDSDVCVT